jgi:nitroreductase
MEVLEAIHTRRSIRKYKSEPVADRTLETVLEAARQAPSWGNTQCWHFVAVRNAETKGRLSDTLNETNPARDAIRNAPLVIVACAETGKSGHRDGKAMTDKGDWFMFDVALAMQNLVLAAHSLGLGTVYVGRFDAREAGRILSVPPGYRAVVMTPLGYPAETKEPRPRKELGEFVHYDKWGPK